MSITPSFSTQSLLSCSESLSIPCSLYFTNCRENLGEGGSEDSLPQKSNLWTGEPISLLPVSQGTFHFWALCLRYVNCQSTRGISDFLNNGSRSSIKLQLKSKQKAKKKTKKTPCYNIHMFVVPEEDVIAAARDTPWHQAETEQMNPKPKNTPRHDLNQQAPPFLLRIKLVTLYYVISVGISHRSREFVV